MFNTDWERLNNIQLGQTAKFIAMAAFSSYGFVVSDIQLRNSNYDFSISRAKEPCLDIKVRSVRGWNYIFFEKEHFVLRESLFAMLVLIRQNELPSLYLIPSLDWHHPTKLLVSRDYADAKSKPEWGVDLSENNQVLLELYQFVKMIV
jgi:hypothetical protein